MLRKLFTGVENEAVKKAIKDGVKEGIDISKNEGRKMINETINRVYYGLLFKAVIGIVVIIGAITATIIGVKYLFGLVA